MTATLDRPSGEDTAITVSVAPVSPAVAGDITLSTDKVLTIPAGRTASTGVVTLTAVDNDTDTPNKAFTISATAANTLGVDDPDDETLTVVDEDPAPKATLVLEQSSIRESDDTNRTGNQHETTVKGDAGPPVESADDGDADGVGRVHDEPRQRPAHGTGGCAREYGLGEADRCGRRHRLTGP